MLTNDPACNATVAEGFNPQLRIVDAPNSPSRAPCITR